MKIIATFILACSFLVYGSQSGFCAADQLSGKIQSFYNNLKGFSADFTQVLEHKESGGKETRQGSLSFKKPLLIRWQTKKPHEETLVVTDKEIWDYLPDEEIAYRYSPTVIQDSGSIIRILTGQSGLARDFDVKRQGSEGKLMKLLLLPHEPSTQLVEATLWVNPDSGQIERARAIDFYGNANDITLANFKNNPSLRNSEFTFSPPKGIEVEDRLEKHLEERELFK